MEEGTRGLLIGAAMIVFSAAVVVLLLAGKCSGSVQSKAAERKLRQVNVTILEKENGDIDTYPTGEKDAE